LAIFLILPVVIFLISAEVVGFVYIRKALLKEWQEIAILQLERAAHQIDMRLQNIRKWMESFAKTGSSPQGAEIQEWLLQQLRGQEGVSQARLIWLAPGDKEASKSPSSQKVSTITPPQYFYPPGEELVGLRSDLLDKAGMPLGQLEVLIKFDYIMEKALTSGWMQSHMACLLDANDGHYLAHSSDSMKGRHCLGETQDPLELTMRIVMKEKPFGTILGKGHPPDQVIGFYRLQGAPWAIMLHAKGSEILAPIVRFRFYYLGTGILGLAIILILIRQGVASMVSGIRSLSQQAKLIAQGEYGKPLQVISQDEIGQLTQSFNEMVGGLKERDFINNTFGRYVDKEIARELLRRPEAVLMGGEKREVVILFSDIRDFTPLAETLSPEATILLVNRHFSRMIEVIQRHRGIIVDFLGDAILTFFDPLGAPLTPVIQQACKCAIEMQMAMSEENASNPDFPSLKMGIGLHVGEVVVGNIGSESRAKYGIIGSAVNLTNRIQALAKGGEVIVSEAAYGLAKEELIVKRNFQARLKGFKESMNLYSVQMRDS
jgi:adenylate cyclase